MKVNKDKKSNKKFDLEKIKVAKLKDLHLINGGEAGQLFEDPKTITGTGQQDTANSKNCL
jgi:hypothetical protein